MLTIDLIRHGALQGGIKYRGHTDDPLTTEGRIAMHGIWQQLSGKVDVIITSPLSRCAKPAQEWAVDTGIHCVVEPRVAEMHYGSWEGKTSKQINEISPGILEQWRRDPTGMRPPGGESPEELRQRLQEWLTEAEQTFRGQHLLLVSHSGTLRMLIALAMHAPIISTRQMAMPYACWSRLQCSEQGNIVVFHNRGESLSFLP